MVTPWHQHPGHVIAFDQPVMEVLFDSGSLTVIESKLVKSLSDCLSTASRVA